MDLEAILRDLRQQRDQLDEAILAIERLASGQSRGRGRPPKWLAAQKAQQTPKRRARQPGKKSVPADKARD
jgi:hypothetical protein